MFVVEYCRRAKLLATEGEAEWERYRPAFPSEERANNEALWLSIDDSDYVYRVVEETE